MPPRHQRTSAPQTHRHKVLEAKARAEEAASTSAAALSAAERQAKAYRGDSTALLSDYDSWVAGLLARKSASGSGGKAGGSAAAQQQQQQQLPRASTLSLSGGAAGAAEVVGLQSPVRDGGLSRSTSQLGTGGAHSPLASPAAAAAVGFHWGQQQQQQQKSDPEVERYDRIAALLQGRGVGGSASLLRALSGKSAAALSPLSSTAAVPAVSRGGGRLSPRPGFD
jgi:hypothetical protein